MLDIHNISIVFCHFFYLLYYQFIIKLYIKSHKIILISNIYIYLYM